MAFHKIRTKGLQNQNLSTKSIQTNPNPCKMQNFPQKEDHGPKIFFA